MGLRLAELNSDDWVQLPAKCNYAVRCDQGDDVYLRLGPKLGVYIAITHAASGRVVNSVNIENGDLTIIGKIPDHGSVIIGRTSDCAIKVMHAIMSRQHLEIRLEGNILTVADLGSTNGTFAHKVTNMFDIDKYLEEHPLKDGQDSTLDPIHETFGATLDDFLKTYSESKGS